jgi:hypothetical protein
VRLSSQPYPHIQRASVRLCRARLLRHYVYFCTSKSSKVSTCGALLQPHPVARNPHIRVGRTYRRLRLLMYVSIREDR